MLLSPFAGRARANRSGVGATGTRLDRGEHDDPAALRDGARGRAYRRRSRFGKRGLAGTGRSRSTSPRATLETAPANGSFVPAGTGTTPASGIVVGQGAGGEGVEPRPLEPESLARRRASPPEAESAPPIHGERPPASPSHRRRPAASAPGTPSGSPGRQGDADNDQLLTPLPCGGRLGPPLVRPRTHGVAASVAGSAPTTPAEEPLDRHPRGHRRR